MMKCLTQKFFVVSLRASQALLLTGLLFQCVGCKKVEPWDRADLAKPTMTLEPWSTPAFMNVKEVEKATEMSRGGTGLGGGGCGCG